MWNDQKSLALTRWGVRLFALALAAADLGSYWLVRWYMSWNTQTIGQGLREGLLMMASLYLCSLPAWAALYWLHRLLGSIAAGQIFVPENVRALRAISWCCAAACAVCLASTFYYAPWSLAGVAAGFMALLVRVIKNCFEQAVRMKDELDYTI